MVETKMYSYNFSKSVKSDVATKGCYTFQIFIHKREILKILCTTLILLIT